MQHRQIRRQKWIDAVRRQNPDGSTWQPSKESRLCSQHFVGNEKSEDPASPAYNPTIFPDVYRKVTTSTEVALGRYERSLKRKHLLNNEEPLLYTKAKTLPHNQNILQSTNETQRQKEVEGFLQNRTDQHFTSDCPLLELGSCLCTTKSLGTQVDFFKKSDEPNFHVFLCNRYVTTTTCEAEVQTCLPSALEKKSVKIVNCVDKSYGTNVQFKDKASGPEERDSNCNRLLKCSAGFHGVSSITSNQAMLDLAGVRISVFQLLLKVLSRQDSSTHSLKVRKDDGLLIFLMKMKTGLTFSALSALFGVHRATVSRIFYSTLTCLTAACKRFVFWPSRELVQTRMPAAFKESYKDCRVIINCTEIQIDQPSSVRHRVQFYSHYKKGFTIKVLVGCTPDGLVSFVSRCYGGRTTDFQITTSSGILDLLEPGDVVLADKGFPEIKAALDDDGRGIIVVMPPFLRNPTFTKEKVDDSYKVASIRIHIEKIMQRLRAYKILNKLPVNMFPHCDKILFMCGVLSNCQPHIIKSSD